LGRAEVTRAERDDDRKTDDCCTHRDDVDLHCLTSITIGPPAPERHVRLAAQNSYARA
jgi:hypothetical protein